MNRFEPNNRFHAGDSQVVTLQLFIDGKAFKYHTHTHKSSVQTRLHEILVLHLEGGRDFFVEVRTVHLYVFPSHVVHARNQLWLLVHDLFHR